MPTSAEIEILHEKVREAAEKSGAYVAHALMELGDNPPPFVVIASEEFPPLIAHVRPRIVYLLKSAFDVAEEIAASSDDDDDDDEEPASANPKLKRLLARWKQKNGSTCCMATAMFCDGVMHSAVLEAEWLEEFETDLERIEIEQAEKRAAQQVQADQKRRNELQGQVEQLGTVPRVSRWHRSREGRA